MTTTHPPTKPEDCAFTLAFENKKKSVDYAMTVAPGMTKREYFAAMAMQVGAIAWRNAMTEQDMARNAVKVADALIVALNEK
jgi:hypothetical protein